MSTGRHPGDRATPAAANAIPDWDETETYEPGDVVRMPDGSVVTIETVIKPFEPLSCGYSYDTDEPSGETYDTEMHEISTSHIGVNPDGTVTPFRSGRDGRPN